MKKIVIMVTAVLLACALFSGCQKKDTKIKIGYLNSNDNDTWLSYLKDEFKAYFDDKPDYELYFENGQDDVVKQTDQANIMITNGVKVLVVNPADSAAMAPITKACKDAGIPVVYVNRNPYVDTTVPEGAYYVGSDSILSGTMQMEELGRLMNGKGNIVILEGNPLNEAAVKRTQGNQDIIKQKYPAIKVLAIQVANFFRDQGKDKMADMLTQFPDIQGVASNNDEMALGAIRAIEEAGRKGILVAGIDGTPDAFAAMKTGKMAFTVLQDASGQGRGAADYAYKLSKGEKVESVNWVPYQLVTPENLANYMK